MPRKKATEPPPPLTCNCEPLKGQCSVPGCKGSLPKPDWFDKPHEEWPPAAREFYRLCWVVGQRIRFHRVYPDQYCGDSNCPKCKERKQRESNASGSAP